MPEKLIVDLTSINLPIASKSGFWYFGVYRIVFSWNSGNRFF